jgi:hypothetical protein
MSLEVKLFAQDDIKLKNFPLVFFISIFIIIQHGIAGAQKLYQNWAWLLKPIILFSLEAEIGRIEV